jgi:hypothetical protein
MSQRSVAITSVVLFAVAVGTGACSSGNGGTPASAARSSKTAFCSANATLDKASVNVDSAAGFVAVLKANTAALNTFAHNVPGGTVGVDAKKLVAAARLALAANSATAFDTPAVVTAGADIDTYCDEQSDGSALPSDFGAGKGSAFCSDESVISTGLNSADDAAALVSFLSNSHSTLVDYAAKIPGAVQGDAQTFVTAAQSAVSSGNADDILNQRVETALTQVDLYCGINH